MKKIITSIALFTLLVNSGAAQAMLVDYTFIITKPLMHGVDMLGGNLTPVVFQFRIDAEAPNLNSPSVITDGVYPINDHGVGGFGTVSIGSEVAFLEGGLIQIGDSPIDRLVATTNGLDDGSRIGGRSLFVSFAHLFDYSGQMFTDINLPLDTSFASMAGGGYFELTFRPAPFDPEFLTRDYVKYGTWVSQGDFTVARSVVSPVPEPATYTMLLAGLCLLSFSARRSKQ
jgi:hypothetical protein